VLGDCANYPYGYIIQENDKYIKGAVKTLTNI
jgi:hypothetical protein